MARQTRNRAVQILPACQAVGCVTGRVGARDGSPGSSSGYSWRCSRTARHPGRASVVHISTPSTFAFPNHFGSNWDALLDCLSDLHWLPASVYVIIMLRARYLETADPKSFNTFLEVCQETAARWRGRKAFFKVVVSSAEASSREQRNPPAPRKPAAE